MTVLTKNKSKKKSKISLHQNLDYNGNSDFWKLYTHNQKLINRIMWALIIPFIGYLDPDDAFQDILIRLYDSEFLKRFDPSKGTKLSTYMISQIKGHILRLCNNNRNRWRPFPTCDVKEKQNLYYEKVLCWELNGIDLQNEEWEPSRKVDDEIALKPKVETELSFNNLCEKVYEKLPEDHCNILEMLINGFSKIDIADQMDVSPATISHKLKNIRAVFCNVLSK